MAADRRTRTILKRLKTYYGDAECSLDYSNPLELLVATILSAQCTDERVNLVTAQLFRKYRSAKDYLDVEASELETDIHSTGFFRNKAKSIRGACAMIVDEFQGEVPDTMDDLLRLPGVARKTANVVLGNAFGKAEGIVVDTHVGRISRRLGLTQHGAPEKVEKDLVAVVPKTEWILFSHMLIAHGRSLCPSRAPKCPDCFLADVCPSAESV